MRFYVINLSRWRKYLIPLAIVLVLAAAATVTFSYQQMAFRTKSPPTAQPPTQLSAEQNRNKDSNLNHNATSKPAPIITPVQIPAPPLQAQTQEQPVYPRAIFRVKTNEKVVALTFDISWGTQVPGPVLDILKQNNIHSTFFLSGPWVLKNPQFPRRIAEEGHEIASHGWEHIDLDKVPAERIAQEIAKAHQAIKEVTGKEASLIRTPNGAWNQTVLQVAARQGYKVIQWSVDSLDWKNPGEEAIIKRVVERVHPGAIILMHASDTCKQTPSALPYVIKGLKDKGYRFVTVSELLTTGPPMYE